MSHLCRVNQSYSKMENIKTLNTQTLTNWLEAGKEITILDVRPSAEREEWSIPKSIHVNVYSRLKEGDPKAMDGLNIEMGKPVVTLCARGKVSLVAAALLAKKGFEVYSLEGGMSAWNYAWDTAEVDLGEVKVIQVRRLAKGCLSYIIGSGNQALVIDASLDPFIYEDVAVQNGWTIEKVTDTHIHADYVSRTQDLAAATGAAHLMLESTQVEYPFSPIKNGESLWIGKAELTVLHTPGHTWESASFLIENKAVFTGDTLFTDGIGRPDLKANKEESVRKASALFESLKMLTSLAKNTQVLPAHISESINVGQPMIAAPLHQLTQSIETLTLTKDKFIESVLEKLPASPPNYLAIAEINRSGIIGDYHIADLEAGANRCAIK